MAHQTERYDFHHLPLKVSGNTTIATVTGYTIWRLKENGGSFALDHIHEVHLRGAMHEIVWIDMDNESIAPAIKQALEAAARNMTNYSSYPDPLLVGEQPELPMAPVDSARVEGAQRSSG